MVNRFVRTWRLKSGCMVLSVVVKARSTPVGECKEGLSHHLIFTF